MNRVKTLGIVAVAALAITAVLGAGVASAAEFRAAKYPQAVTPSETSMQTISTNTGNIKCTALSLSGSIGAPASSQSLVPKYSGCKAFGLSASVSANSCAYVFNSTTEKHPYGGTFDVSCGKAGDAIEFSVVGCQVKLPAQTGVGPVEFINDGSGYLRLLISATGLKYTESGGSCAGNGTYSNGTMSGSAGTEGVNLFKASAAAFEAGFYPAILSAVQKAQVWLSFSQTSTSCTTLSGSGQLSAASGGITLAPQFSGCLGTVKANSCSLALNAADSYFPFASGSMGVSCGTPGDSIRIERGTCIVTIPAQSNAGSVGFVDQGEGNARTVEAVLNAGGLNYTEGSGCGAPGTRSNGKVTGSILVNAANSGTGIWVE